MRYFTILILFFTTAIHAQQASIIGYVKEGALPIPITTVWIPGTSQGTTTDLNGWFVLNQLPPGKTKFSVKCIGYQQVDTVVHLTPNETLSLNFRMVPFAQMLDEVVVSGSMREISRRESTIPVEVITPALFQKNPSGNLLESTAMIAGVQPQVNCNICNTGDIHINGMEGPYTLVMIDGSPIVSALGSVYGLSGIPNGMISRVEVVKGPASSLYGSEAMGGTINVITKDPGNSALTDVDIFGTGWNELNADLASSYRIGQSKALTGISGFHYNSPADHNSDGFTDLAIQKRISIFQKWSGFGPERDLVRLAARMYYEDRWGGEMNWSPQWRGSDSIYGESIYTKRYEVFGGIDLNEKKKIRSAYSYNFHEQNSWYGNMPFMAYQHTAFGQIYLDTTLFHAHNLLLGTFIRATWYDDNTPATAVPNGSKNKISETILPGIFCQDEWNLSEHARLLAGYRYEYEKHHGHVHTPRLAWKYGLGGHVVRASLGSGYRVVNLFTEDHAALTGGREVIISENLHPERSWSSNFSYGFNRLRQKGSMYLDISGFYTYFTNKIMGDFDSDPGKIIYKNLDGHATYIGCSMTNEIRTESGWSMYSGITWMQAEIVSQGAGVDQLRTPEWSGNFTLGKTIGKNFTADATGNWYGPMRLPVVPNDYRPEYSPWHCILNIKLKYSLPFHLELYTGCKNMLNFIPKNPILRPHDPFDKNADDPITNPSGYRFDPSYNYGSLQGRRFYAGIKWSY